MGTADTRIGFGNQDEPMTGDSAFGEYFGHVSMLPHRSTLDSFNRMRVSNPKVVFESTHVDDTNGLLFDQTATGGATITAEANKSAMQFALGTASGDKCTRQSYEYFPYVPGNSHTFIGTGILGAGTSASSQRIGLFDDNDGVFFELKNQALGVVIRSSTSGSPVNTRVEQASWNVDTMDGNGPSGITLDTTKTQIFHISYEWLGVGTVIFSIVVNGAIHVVHKVHHSNSTTAVYMKRGSLPVRFENENTALTTATTDFRQICAMVMVEGDRTDKNRLASASNGATGITITTAYTPLISVRVDSNTPRALLEVDSFSGLVTTNDDVEFSLHFNANLTGGSWATSSSGLSNYNLSAAYTTGGDDPYFATWANQQAGNIDARPDKFVRRATHGITITTQDTVTLCGRARTGTAVVHGSVNYKEII